MVGSPRLFNGEYKCWHYHQDFKRDFVAGWGAKAGNDDSWQISGDEIAAWLETQPGRRTKQEPGTPMKLPAPGRRRARG